MDSAGLPSGVFPDQGWNLCPLLWQGGHSLPLSCQETPQAILDSSFPRSYLVREAWELAVLSPSPGSAIKRAGASGKHLLLPQSCLTLFDPMDRSPPGSCPWDFPGKTTGVGCHFLLQRFQSC